LIIIGRSAKDPDMLLVAAKLLSTVEAPVADPKATSADVKPVFYDVDGLVAEAKSYSANRTGSAVAELFRLLPLRISLR
jgi:hypothetical protein